MQTQLTLCPAFTGQLDDKQLPVISPNLKLVLILILYVELKFHQNTFSVGAPPRSPLGELTTLGTLPLSLDAFGVHLVASQWGPGVLECVGPIRLLWPW